MPSEQLECTMEVYNYEFRQKKKTQINNMQKVKHQTCNQTAAPSKSHSDLNLAGKSKWPVSYTSICAELLTINIHSQDTALEQSRLQNNKPKLTVVRGKKCPWDKIRMNPWTDSIGNISQKIKRKLLMDSFL